MSVKVKGKAGRPPKANPIPSTEFKGIVDHKQDRLFHYVCPHPMVIHSWLQTIMTKPMKPDVIRVLAKKDKFMFYAIKQIPVSKHGVVKKQEKHSVITIDCKNSYEYYINGKEKLIDFNVTTFMQSLNKNVNNLTIMLEFFVTINDSNKFQVRSIPKQGPKAKEKIHCIISDHKEEDEIIPKTEIEGGFLTFKNINNEDYKKMFSSKLYSNGSNLSNITIEKDHSIILTMPGKDELTSDYTWDKDDIGEANGIIYTGKKATKGAKLPHKDIATFCAKDKKNPVTFVLSDEECIMFRKKEEMTFYHKVPLIEEQVPTKK